MEISSKNNENQSGVINTPTSRTNSFLFQGEVSVRPVEVFLPGNVHLNDGTERLFRLKRQSSISTNATRKVWIIRSQSGRMKSIVNYLFHKWLFAELTKKERLLFHDLHETLTNSMIYSALRASALGYSKVSIRRALKYSSKILFGNSAPSIEKWEGYRTLKLSFEIEERRTSERKVQRYSGWRRHQNDQGSMAPQREDPFYLEPLIENDTLTIFLEIVKEIDSGSRELFINQLRISL